MSLFPCLTTQGRSFQPLALGSGQCTGAARSPVLFDGICAAHHRAPALHQVLGRGERMPCRCSNWKLTGEKGGSEGGSSSPPARVAQEWEPCLSVPMNFPPCPSVPMNTDLWLFSLAAPRSHYLADSGRFCLPYLQPVVSWESQSRAGCRSPVAEMSQHSPDLKWPTPLCLSDIDFHLWSWNQGCHTQ